jgi:predicted Fe-Mo cluster-binding NifX family protein
VTCGKEHLEMRAIVVSVMALGLLAPAARGGDEREAKMAVASQEREVDGAVAQRAGRAPYYLLFGRDGDLLEVAENPSRNARRRAGAGTAEFLASKGATLVVAGHFGQNMTQALDRRGIGHLEFSGTIADALKKARDQGAGTPK